MAEELVEFGITLLLAPAMNIHPQPRCADATSGYSERSSHHGQNGCRLCARYAVKPGVGATIKHFCCNNREDNRFGVNENVSERALREIYLAALRLP